MRVYVEFTRYVLAQLQHLNEKDSDDDSSDSEPQSEHLRGLKLENARTVGTEQVPTPNEGVGQALFG